MIFQIKILFQLWRKSISIYYIHSVYIWLLNVYIYVCVYTHTRWWIQSDWQKSCMSTHRSCRYMRKGSKAFHHDPINHFIRLRLPLSHFQLPISVSKMRPISVVCWQDDFAAGIKCWQVEILTSVILCVSLYTPHPSANAHTRRQAQTEGWGLCLWKFRVGIYICIY